MRRYLSHAILVGALLAACADPVSPGPVRAGTWGGNNAGAIVSDSGAHVHIGCTAGQAEQPLVADSSGHFTATGRFNITLHPIATGPDHPARFEGTIAGRTMTLTVTLTDTTVTLGPVRLTFGREPQMGPCPICRRPGDRMTAKESRAT